MTENVAPALYQHVCKVYDLMKQGAKNLNGDLIYEGKTTSMIRELGLGNNYYSPIFKYLRGGNYITQLRRGGGGNDSAFQINERPLLEDYDRDVKMTGANETGADKALSNVVKMRGEMVKMQETINTHSRAIMMLQSIILKGTDPSQATSALGTVTLEETLEMDDDLPDFTDLTPPEDGE